jgi:hypothetical protein
VLFLFSVLFDHIFILIFVLVVFFIEIPSLELEYFSYKLLALPTIYFIDFISDKLIDLIPIG